MLDRDRYDCVCASAADLGEAQRQRLAGTVIAGLGASVSEMFPGFAAAFPRTVAAIEREYATPVVLFKKHAGVWMASLVAEGPALNLFFDLVPLSLETEGPVFEENCAMLPTGWKELYRHFWSFVLTERSYPPMDWTNSPFSYSGRLSLERYRQLRGVKKSLIRDFAGRTGAQSLYCWLLTDAGDALFLDEGKCDGKLYHVSNDDFADYRLLEDPETVLDHYLAHYVTTRSAQGFVFRG